MPIANKTLSHQKLSSERCLVLRKLLLIPAVLFLLFGLGAPVVMADPVPEGKGRITIIKDTDPETDEVEFDFDFDPGSDFDLEDDEEIVLVLNPGKYTITELAKTGWVLSGISCDNPAITKVDFTLRRATIDLKEYDDVRCWFNNVKVATPTPTPVPTATPVPPTPVPPEIVIVPQVIFVPAPQPAPQQVIVERVVERAPAPVIRQSTSTSGIKPPSTGDGNLK